MGGDDVWSLPSVPFGPPPPVPQPQFLVKSFDASLPVAFPGMAWLSCVWVCGWGGCARRRHPLCQGHQPGSGKALGPQGQWEDRGQSRVEDFGALSTQRGLGPGDHMVRDVGWPGSAESLDGGRGFVSEHCPWLGSLTTLPGSLNVHPLLCGRLGRLLVLSCRVAQIGGNICLCLDLNQVPGAQCLWALPVPVECQGAGEIEGLLCACSPHPGTLPCCRVSWGWARGGGPSQRRQTCGVLGCSVPTG